MHANAAEQQIDVRRIGIWGYSAGAQLASLLGVLSPGDPNFAEGLRVQAVVSGGTPVDLRRGADSQLISQYIGRPIAEVPELYLQASPIAYVSKDDPPMPSLVTSTSSACVKSWSVRVFPSRLTSSTESDTLRRFSMAAPLMRALSFCSETCAKLR